MSLSSFLFHCAMCWWGRSEWEDAGVQGGKHLRKLTRYRVLSKKRSAGFSAMADLISACSLAFLDGPTGLHLTFTVTLHRKREVKTGGGAVITDIPMQWVTWEKGTVQVYSGDSVCFSYSRILKGKKKSLSGGWCLWSSNRLCRDWGRAEGESGGRHVGSREGFMPRIPGPCEPLCMYAHVSAALNSSYTYWTDGNQDFGQ